MNIGIFTKVWQGRPLDDILLRMEQLGLRYTQFNLTCAGVEQMPAQIAPALVNSIRAAFASHNIVMSAISGTFNMIHPDDAVLADNLRRLQVLTGACHTLGTQVITICTGTYDAHDMWRWHPDNSTPQAWARLVDTLERALPIAAAAGVCLAFEPEQANVITSAHKARRLLDHFASPHLKVTFDAANLFERATLAEQRRIVSEACDLLGADIALAHAKDRDASGAFVAAGEGVLDYTHYITELRRAGYDGALVLHGLSPAQAPACAAFLRSKLQDAQA